MILVIDDDKSIREAIKFILETAGHTVLEAGDGREGVALFAQYQAEIEAVLMDLSMPVMSGWEAMNEMLQYDPNAKIILSSGYLEGDSPEMAGTKQPAGFLQKPYNLYELVAKVNQVIS